MEIIKRSAQGPAKFQVLKSFYLKVGQLAKSGETIEIENPNDQVLFCLQGRIRPVLPETGVYIALMDITLPGRKEKFEAKKLELVELKADDALPLLLNRSVIPKDESQWRPFGRKLQTKGNKK